MTLKNPSRVVPKQTKYVKFNLSTSKKQPEDEIQRYCPLLGNERQSGFILLTDSTPGEPEEFVEVVSQPEEKEPEPPQPFEWSMEADD